MTHPEPSPDAGGTWKAQGGDSPPGQAPRRRAGDRPERDDSHKTTPASDMQGEDASAGAGASDSSQAHGGDSPATGHQEARSSRAMKQTSRTEADR